MQCSDARHWPARTGRRRLTRPQIYLGFITRIDLVQGLLPVGHRPYLGLQVWNGDPVLGRCLHGPQQLACGRSLRHDLQTGAF